MTRIKTDDKKTQMVYIYSVGNYCASVEIKDVSSETGYTHCHLELDELEAFIKDCQELLDSMKNNPKYVIGG